MTTHRIVVGTPARVEEVEYDTLSEAYSNASRIWKDMTIREKRAVSDRGEMFITNDIGTEYIDILTILIGNNAYADLIEYYPYEFEGYLSVRPKAERDEILADIRNENDRRIGDDDIDDFLARF